MADYLVGQTGEGPSSCATLADCAERVKARVDRHQALQDMLLAITTASQTNFQGNEGLLADCLTGLSALLPDSVIQQALQLVDQGEVSCIQSRRGRRLYSVRGKGVSHMVIANGLYCSCPYYAMRVIEAGELCCKHWLAVQLALAKLTPNGTDGDSLGPDRVQILEEEDFVDYIRQHF
eukprot:CAMPEP_0206532524 /NCGR_PEP_ID=MMETSP0325_2-20121206/4437_1 /ASSEMBLY_ACC=CAM_ASM_000347 /TAXON_ID=2866 /ORGANISM="Crypthecodinium cohnii, Strain Seligo" /LENGTH=177 /DNA_ID=CAMNT_0054029025 /DNA_START=63 /DNA_END=593 /DNA_ORIENTATION=+